MAPKQDFGNSLDLVNIKEIRDDTVILKDGGMRQIIMVGGVNFALKSETEQNIMTQAYQTFLNGIDFPLQIVVHSRKVNIDKYARPAPRAEGTGGIGAAAKPDRGIRRIHKRIRAEERDHGKIVPRGRPVLSLKPSSEQKDRDELSFLSLRRSQTRKKR